MGVNQSRTRKLTVENDDSTSVIKVSDDVVQRIRNSQDVRSTPEQPLPQAPAVPLVVPPPFMYESSATTVQLRQANVAELKKNDEYWQKRLKNLQANHQKIHEIMDQEYKKAVEGMHDKQSTDEPSCRFPPCQEAKEAVMECYRKHPDEPMRCAKVVQAFQDCVDSKRSSLIANRG